MRGKPPFYFLDNCTVDVRNLAAAESGIRKSSDGTKRILAEKKSPGDHSPTCTFLVTTHFFQ